MCVCLLNSYRVLNVEREPLLAGLDPSRTGRVAAAEVLARIEFPSLAPAPAPTAAPHPVDGAVDDALLQRDVDALLARIGRAAVGSPAGPVDAVVASVDSTASGQLTRGQTSDALGKLGYAALGVEVDLLFRGLSSSGTIPAATLVRRLTAADPSAAPAPAPPAPTSAPAPAEAPAPAPAPTTAAIAPAAPAATRPQPSPKVTATTLAVERDVARLVARLARATGTHPPSAVAAVFSAMDVDGSGSLHRGELGEAVAKLGYELLDSELDVLMARFDNNGDGRVTSQEFVSQVFGVHAGTVPGSGQAAPAPEHPVPAAAPAHGASEADALALGSAAAQADPALAVTPAVNTSLPAVVAPAVAGSESAPSAPSLRPAGAQAATAASALLGSVEPVPEPRVQGDALALLERVATALRSVGRSELYDVFADADAARTGSLPATTFNRCMAALG